MIPKAKKLLEEAKREVSTRLRQMDQADYLEAVEDLAEHYRALALAAADDEPEDADV